MIRTLGFAALASIVVLAATPAFAQIDLPIVGTLPTPGHGLDLDPLHIFTPAPAPEPAAAPAPKKKHHHHHMMHKKTVKK